MSLAVKKSQSATIAATATMTRASMPNRRLRFAAAGALDTPEGAAEAGATPAGGGVAVRGAGAEAFRRALGSAIGRVLFRVVVAPALGLALRVAAAERLHQLDIEREGARLQIGDRHARLQYGVLCNQHRLIVRQAAFIAHAGQSISFLVGGQSGAALFEARAQGSLARRDIRNLVQCLHEGR